MPTKQLVVRYFASIREAVGTDREQWHTEAATVDALRDELIVRGAPWSEVLAHGRAVRAAVNQLMARGDTPLTDGAEVAFFPPVTGG